jgi:hypothetical protein
VAQPAFARGERPVRAERARGSAPRSSARTTNEVRGTGSRRGFVRPNDGANLHLESVRSRSACLFGGARCAARQPVPSPRGGGRRRRRSEARHLTLAERGIDTARGRCPCIVVLQKSVERPQAQRSVPPVTDGSKARSLHGAREREPDHRRSLRRASARGHRRQKGGGSSELGDPHHVSAASSMKAARSRLRFGAGGVRARVYRQKAPRIGKAHAFHEAPAEPILAASEPTHARSKKSEHGRGIGGGDRGVRGARSFDFTRRKKTPPREDRPVAEVRLAP